MTKFWWFIAILVCLVILNNYFRIFAFNCILSADEGSFRLMTYNTNGVAGDYEDEEFANDFLSAIDSIYPQVLVLQEMSKDYSPYLCDELQKRYPYNSLSELSKTKVRNQKVACLFSMYPIRSFFRIKYDRQEIESVYKENTLKKSKRHYSSPEIFNSVIDIDGRETLLVCCYLKTNDYSKLRNEHSNNWSDGLEDYIDGYNLASQIRSLNVKMIRDSIAKYDLPTIVCGDMNDFQFSRPLKILMGDDLKNVWWERGMGYGMTYNMYHLMLRIDHVLVSKDFVPVSVDVPHLRFSDHYPIVTNLHYILEN